MNKKYFFFDIDGTLTNSNPGGIVEQDTLDTLDKLRANGHFVAIATGRAEWMTKEFSRDTKIDNLVTDGGNGIVINNEIIYIKPLPKQLTDEVIHECLEKNVGFCVVLDNTGNRYTHNHLMHFDDEKMNQFLNITVKEDLDYDNVGPIYKINVRSDHGEYEKLECLKHITYMGYPGESVIWIEPADKTQGIRDMVTYLGGDYQDVVVFGDGRNDLKMIQDAPISIAMGNAIDEVKQAATFVTKRNDEGGITYACKHFGWID